MNLLNEKTSLFSDLVKSIKDGNADVALQSIEKFKKSQAVRVMDVAVIGPLMIYYGVKGRLGPIERTLLILMGGGTIVYNYRNYIKNKSMHPIVEQAKDILVEQVSELPLENIRDVTPQQNMNGYY